jgi:hypothetical protein
MASAEAVPSTSAALSRRTRALPEHFRCREGSPTTQLANSRGPLRTGPTAQDRMPCGCAGCGSHTGCDHPDGAVQLFARMLIGLAIGADSAIATAYIAE